MFDLIEPDPRRRQRAEECHAGFVAARHEAVARANEIWQLAGRSWVPADATLAAAMERVRAAWRDALAHTVQGMVGTFLDAQRAGGPDDQAQLAPYAVLFLRWEAASPGQWRHAGPTAPWWYKKQVLRSFARNGVPGPQRDALTGLLVAAVHREHRCEDCFYPALARHLDGPALRAALIQAQVADDAVVRLRARYVEWVADHADEPVSLAGWRRWLADADDPSPRT
ncbi:MAG TPA: hypothetical protein VFU65_04905 [Actinocrinis sp.]|nr:hypothetical protein [Actinocrinis sp.]